ncbi:MAG: DUF805 domain-containing protein [Rothia sp. (in: high G+C Gram-positive bacteria)]|nr:DUF805 domain-containing protein [Rothia sp. (in: high G+C Gram-positive bacteria)]
METTVYDQPASTGSRPRPTVNFSQAIKNNFKYLFHFSGRASRSEFWWVYGAFSLVSLIIAIILTFAFNHRLSEMDKFEALTTQYANGEITYAEYHSLAESGTGPAYGVIILLGLLLLWSLISLACTLAVSWRRLQDAGFHGAFYLLSLVGFLALSPLSCTSSPAPPRATSTTSPPI